MTPEERRQYERVRRNVRNQGTAWDLDRLDNGVTILRTRCQHRTDIEERTFLQLLKESL